MQNIKPGSLLNNGKYRVDLAIGQGGFGITYLGQHTILATKIAIKEYFPQQYCDRDDHSNNIVAKSTSSAKEMARFRTKFIKEAITLSKLNHPNIVRILDVFEDNGSAYFVMDFIDGMTLKDMVECEPLPIDRAIDYTRRIAGALQHIHEKRINHLDIKPANIIVRASDNQPILIDFGLAKSYDSMGNQTSATPLGVSRGYAPLEQYTGAIESFSPESDLYSLGATLYKIATGINPPEPSTILNTGHIDFPDFIPETIRRIVTKAMSVSKSERYHTADDFIADLDKAFGPAPECDVETDIDDEITANNLTTANTLETVKGSPTTEDPADDINPDDADVPAENSDDPCPIREPEPVLTADEDTTSAEAPVHETDPDNSRPSTTGNPDEPATLQRQQPSDSGQKDIDIDLDIPVDDTDSTSDVENIELPKTPEAPETPCEKPARPSNAKKSRGAVILLIVLVLALAAGAAIYYLWSNASSDNTVTASDSIPATVETVDNATDDIAEIERSLSVTGMPVTISGIKGSYTGTLNADSIPDMKTNAYVKFDDKTYDFYKGDITGGKITGHGFLQTIDGTTFEGTFNDGEILDGEIKYRSGESYKGSFKDNEFFNGIYYNNSGKAAFRYDNGKESRL